MGCEKCLPGKSSREKQTLINTAWVSMPVGILIALGIAFLLHMHPPNSKADSDGIEPAVYTRSIAYTFFGVVLAFLHEPMFLLALSDMKQGLRARVTVAAQFGKSFVQVILLVVFADKGFGIEAFALANVAYAGVLLLGYFAHFALQQNAECRWIQRISSAKAPDTIPISYSSDELWMVPQIF